MDHSDKTPFPRRLALAIAIASAAVTVAVGVTIGSLTGYLGAERAPAPAVEPVSAPTAPIHPKPSPPPTAETQVVLVPVRPEAPDPVATVAQAEPERFAPERRRHHEDDDHDDDDHEEHDDDDHEEDDDD